MSMHAAPTSEPMRPWTSPEDVEVRHTKWTSEHHTTVMRQCAVTSAVFSTLADRLKLSRGGYGALGVCNDTTALVASSAGEKRNWQWPCMLGGPAKVLVMQELKVCLLGLCRLNHTLSIANLNQCTYWLMPSRRETCCGTRARLD